MQTRTIVEYVLIAIVVMILGAFAGWYFYLRSQSKETLATDTARGIDTTLESSAAQSSGSSAPNIQPSFLSRIWEGITGGGDGVSPSPAEYTFGESAPAALTPQEENATSTPPAKKLPQLWHVHEKPISGASFVKSGTTERLRFIERATGYTYEVDVETGEMNRIDNTLSPKVYEAIVSPSGRVFQRTIGEGGSILTAVSVLTIGSNSPATTTEVKAASTTPLTKDILALAAHPTTDEIFYIVRDVSGVSGYRATWNGANAKEMFSSAIIGWRPVWLSDGRIILTQAASTNRPGFAYELSSKSGLVPLVRDVPGLTLLPRSSGAMLFGESNASGLKLFAQISPTTTVSTLSVKTIADKCAWVPDISVRSTSSGKVITKMVRNLVAYCGVPQGTVPANFLDLWYRGAVHTTDALWRIDANAGSATAAYNPDSTAKIDVENPSINSTGQYMTFMNKTDKSLWLFRMEK